VKEVGSGASQRQQREKLLESARRREIDVVLVWRLDRWGRSVTDLLSTLQELEHLGVGFVSLSEALDLTTPAGRAMAGLRPFSPSSNARYCGNGYAPVWPTPGGTARNWGGPSPLESMPTRCESCIAPASAKPKSPAGCRSAVPPFAGFWGDPISWRNRVARLLTQPYRKDTIRLSVLRHASKISSTVHSRF
jgi:hypothetical protein